METFYLDINKNKCAKQTVVAVIENNGEYYIGSNWCDSPQPICPRGDMPSGEGYDKCRGICEQQNHAEVNACIKAGNKARGGTLYLYGHYYSCENCKKVMESYGIKKLVIIRDV